MTRVDFPALGMRRLFLVSWIAGASASECSSWAEAGECTRNSPFMLSKCKSECCAQFFTQGDCAKGPELAQQHCAVECRCSERVRSGSCADISSMELDCQRFCLDDKLTAFTDLRKDCAEWAKNGECVRNSGFMLPNCALSCAKKAADESLATSTRRKQKALQANPAAELKAAGEFKKRFGWWQPINIFVKRICGIPAWVARGARNMTRKGPV